MTTICQAYFQLVKPRIRFREKDKEIQLHSPVDRESEEYRTLRILDIDEETFAKNICVREVIIVHDSLLKLTNIFFF